MSNLSEIVTTQNKLEEHIARRFDDLQAQITNAGSSKDTVAKVADELRTFKELVFGILGLLRQQIRDCAKNIDDLETRSRQKALIISGLPEKTGENCVQAVLEVFNTKLELQGITTSSLRVCHRLGAPNKGRHRPILVRFADTECRSAAWKSKTKLKGSSISLKEFLTKGRQALFNSARSCFGMRSVWTQNGVIVIKTSDGNIHRITSDEQLAPLTAQRAGAQAGTSVGTKNITKS